MRSLTEELDWRCVLRLIDSRLLADLLLLKSCIVDARPLQLHVLCFVGLCLDVSRSRGREGGKHEAPEGDIQTMEMHEMWVVQC